MYKKLLVSLLIAGVVLGSAFLLLPQGTAQAQFEVTTAAMTDLDTVLPNGSEVITSSGFASAEQVEVLLNNVRLARATADTTGTITVTVTIPTDIVYGTVTFKAQNSGATKVVTDAATLNPGLAVSAASGSAGSPITVQGFAFANAETYVITFTNGYSAEVSSCVDDTATVSTSLGTGTTSRLGSFSKAGTVPAVDAGEYRIVAKGATSGVCAVY